MARLRRSYEHCEVRSREASCLPRAIRAVFVYEGEWALGPLIPVIEHKTGRVSSGNPQPGNKCAERRSGAHNNVWTVLAEVLLSGIE
jgi:hypothetical protein